MRHSRLGHLEQCLGHDPHSINNFLNFFLKDRQIVPVFVLPISLGRTERGPDIPLACSSEVRGFYLVA